MKVALLIVAAATIGVIYAEAINEDQRRDLMNYSTRSRSKRALCGAEKPKATPRPTWYRPTNCNYCTCNQIMTSKRAVDSSSAKAAIWPINPIRPYCDYNRCCRYYPFGSITKGASASAGASASKSVDVNKMASSLITAFGKRATNKNFKKPSVDLIFLIDDSGSIAASQFKVAKEGAATLSQAVCPQKFGSSKGEKQVSAVLFSTTAKMFLTYQQSQKGAGFVEDKILDLNQRSGATSTTDAIRYVRETVLTQPGNRLNDPDTATIVFVITDGKCNDGCSTLKSEAKKLREAGPGVQVFAFGVGEADCDELEIIKGTEAGDVFGLPDYNYFEKLANAVKQQMAKNADKICVK